MLVRRFVVAAALTLATLTSAGARGAEPNRCSLGTKYPVRSVMKYSTSEDAGYTIFTQFRGAEVIVPAQPGLTREWLQRLVSYQIAAGECDFGVPGATVTVLPAGAAFSVRVEGKDEKAAAEILRHAELLVR
jgi:hypothetical protein